MFTLVVPAVTMIMVSIVFMLTWILYQSPNEGPTKYILLAVLTIAILPSVVLAIQLATLVRYTMRVLPFRSTKLLASWVTLSGLAFLATHLGYLLLEQTYLLERDIRSLYGFLLVLCVVPLPTACTGWAVLLWPPLSHSVNLPLIAHREGEDTAE